MHFGFLPGGCSTSLDIKTLMGSKQNHVIKTNLFDYKLNGNRFYLRDAEDRNCHPFSSDPECSPSLMKRKDDKFRSFLHKVGNNHYRSMIENQIYHLSC